MTAGARPGPDLGTPGVAARRRSLTRQALVGLGTVVVLAALVVLLRHRVGPGSHVGSALAQAPLVLGLATGVLAATLGTRWWADLGTVAGRALWSSADRPRVDTVRAVLVQRLPLPPQERGVAGALARAETAGPGRVAAAVDLVGPAVVPAAVFVPQLSHTAVRVAVVVIAVLVVIAVGPRLWLRHRFVAGARAQGLLP